MKISNVEALGPSKLKRCPVTMRCPVDDTGINSVRPSTSPKMTAYTNSIIGRCPLLPRVVALHTCLPSGNGRGCIWLPTGKATCGKPYHAADRNAIMRQYGRSVAHFSVAGGDYS